MPVLLNNQTANTENGGQQEQVYDQEDNSSVNQQTNHVTSTEPVVRGGSTFTFFKIIFLAGGFVTNA